MTDHPACGNQSPHEAHKTMVADDVGPLVAQCPGIPAPLTEARCKCSTFAQETPDENPDMSDGEMEAEQARTTFCKHMIARPEQCGYCHDEAAEAYYRITRVRGESTGHRDHREAWMQGWLAAQIIPDRVTVEDGHPNPNDAIKAREPIKHEEWCKCECGAQGGESL